LQRTFDVTEAAEIEARTFKATPVVCSTPALLGDPLAPSVG